MPRKPKKLKPIPTTLFSFKGDQFTAEASDLNGYEFNSCITLVNPATHNEVLFDLVEVHRDNEGDVMWWLFRSKQHQLRIQLFND